MKVKADYFIIVKPDYNKEDTMIDKDEVGIISREDLLDDTDVLERLRKYSGDKYTVFAKSQWKEHYITYYKKGYKRLLSIN